MKFRIILLFILLNTINVNGQIYSTSKTPRRIILNLTPQSANSIAVSWRTLARVDSPKVACNPATDWTDIENEPKIIIAATESCMVDSIQMAYHHSAVIRGLEPEKIYAYRVGGDGEWSAWNQFRTADDTPAAFEFVFFW